MGRGAAWHREAEKLGKIGGFSFWTRPPRGCHNPLKAADTDAGVTPQTDSRFRAGKVVQSFLISALLLAVFVAAGIVAIVTIRSRYRGRGAEGGDWESALAGYKNLRDKGVLSDEEYRKIRTLVEPRADR